MWGRCFALALLAACGRIGFDPRSDSRFGGDAGPVGNRAFVTSSLQAAASFGGLAGADRVCMDRARDGGLDGRFVAYLSTTMVDAMDRLAGARGWYRVDGHPLVDTADDLINGKMLVPLRLDERGHDLVPDIAYVTTGTYQGVASSTCGDYTDPAATAASGLAAEASDSFSNGNQALCSSQTRLYCFQTDYNLPIVYTPATGRRAFLSTGLFSPGSGLGAADTLCGSEAQAAGYPGTFLALLPTSAPAAQRFDAAGPPWVRPDGILLARTAADLLAGKSLTPLNVQTNGAFREVLVETGGYEPTAPPDLQRNCDTFTNMNGGNAYGFSAASDAAMFTQTTSSDCTSQVPVYCLQQ